MSVSYFLGQECSFIQLIKIPRGCYVTVYHSHHKHPPQNLILGKLNLLPTFQTSRHTILSPYQKTRETKFYLKTVGHSLETTQS